MSDILQSRDPRLETRPNTREKVADHFDARVPPTPNCDRASPMRRQRASFAGARRRGSKIAGDAAVIAEVKKRESVQRDPRRFRPAAAIARSYEAGGVACLSVLTDVDFFRARMRTSLPRAKLLSLPVLRKVLSSTPTSCTRRARSARMPVLLIAAALDDAATGRLRRARRRTRAGRAGRGARRGRTRARAAPAVGGRTGSRWSG